MQDNTVTLNVDATNDGSPVGEVFTRHSFEANRSTYRGPGHSAILRNIMQFFRKDPVRKGENRGFQRSNVKYTTDVSVLNASGSGDIVLPLIAEVSFTVPVGVTPTQTMALRQRVIAILDDDSVSADLVDLLEI